MAEIEIIIGLIAIATAAGSLVANYYQGVIKSNERLAKSDRGHDHRFGLIENEMSSIRVKVDIFWKMLEEHIPKMVIKPTHLHRDELVRKWVAHTITPEEEAELKQLMQQAYDEAFVEKSADAWNFRGMIMLMEQREIERGLHPGRQQHPV